MHEEESVMTINIHGDKYWRNKNGKLHRIDNPAVEYRDGTKEWWQMGKLHRIDGPAVEYKNGDRYWYRKGKLHRIEGPAIDHINGIDGSIGLKEWYIEGKSFQTKESFFEALTDEEKEVALFSHLFVLW